MLAWKLLEQNTFTCLFTRKDKGGNSGLRTFPFLTFLQGCHSPHPQSRGELDQITFLSGGKASLCVFPCVSVRLCFSELYACLVVQICLLASLHHCCVSPADSAMPATSKNSPSLEYGPTWKRADSLFFLPSPTWG